MVFVFDAEPDESIRRICVPAATCATEGRVAVTAAVTALQETVESWAVTVVLALTERKAGTGAAPIAVLAAAASAEVTSDRPRVLAGRSSDTTYQTAVADEYTTVTVWKYVVSVSVVLPPVLLNLSEPPTATVTTFVLESIFLTVTREPSVGATGTLTVNPAEVASQGTRSDGDAT